MDANKQFINEWTSKFGIIYIVVSTIIFAILNFYFRGTINIFIVYLIWIPVIIVLFYPALVFIKYENWRIENFGITFNRSAVLVSLLAALTVAVVGIMRGSYFPFRISLLSSLVPLLVRVGEEFFYRGFLFKYFELSFSKKRKPKIWTIIISSLVFAIIHTQTFLPTNNQTMVDIFVYSIIFNITRYYTKSILPSVVLHCISEAGLFGGIIGAVVYFLIYRLRDSINNINKECYN